MGGSQKRFSKSVKNISLLSLSDYPAKIQIAKKDKLNEPWGNHPVPFFKSLISESNQRNTSMRSLCLKIDLKVISQINLFSFI